MLATAHLVVVDPARLVEASSSPFNLFLALAQLLPLDFESRLSLSDALPRNVPAGLSLKDGAESLLLLIGVRAEQVPKLETEDTRECIGLVDADRTLRSLRLRHRGLLPGEAAVGHELGDLCLGHAPSSPELPRASADLVL